MESRYRLGSPAQREGERRVASNNDPAKIISEMRDIIQQQDEFINKLKEQVSPYATVCYVGEKKVLVSVSGGLSEANAPDFEVRPGQTVKIIPQTGQIIEAGMVNVDSMPAKVVEVVSDHRVKVSTEDGAQIFVFKDPGVVLEGGDSVSLDSARTVVINRIARETKKYVRTGTGVSWSDIGGLEDVKRQMEEIVELPLREPEIFKHYGYEPPKGVLLSGPPGCGKTMIGKAVATAIAAAHDAESGFIYVKGPEVLNKFVGESEATIRSIFDQAREHQRRTGAPAVIFVDEAESLLSRRGSGQVADMEKTIVPAFLAEMDGIEPSGAVVILATNRPDKLDPAIVRDGRVDRKIEVKRPDRPTALAIASVSCKSTPTWECTREEIAVKIVDELNRPDRVVSSVNTQRGVVDVTVRDIISGAMIANVVSRACSIALHRDLSERTRTGVTCQDIVSAIDIIQVESQKIDHTDAVLEIMSRPKVSDATAAKAA